MALDVRCAIVLIFAFTTRATLVENPIQISETFKISPYDSSTTNSDDSGVIYNARQCGGSGRVVKHWYEQCVAGLPGPCLVSPLPTSRHGVVFVPSGNSKNVELRTTMFSNGRVKQFTNSIRNSDLVAGKEYIVTAAGGVAPELRGSLFTAQLEVIRGADRQVEVCSQADFYAI